MKAGLQLPNFGPFSEIDRLIALAQTAEAAGWDGFFLWDHVAIPDRMVDTMTVLAAIATATDRIHFGPMITSPSRRRPWKLAREAVTLDQLSGGRFVLGVGLGESEHDFARCHEAIDARTRAERLDDSLAILDGLWQGDSFSYTGKHFQVDDLRFLPRPVQQPRIPIWVAGRWPNKAPMRRAARWDGVFPIGKNATTLTPSDWQDLMAYIAPYRNAGSPFDAVHSGITPADPAEASAAVQPYAAAGVTWWLEDISPVRVGLKLGEPWPEPWPIARIVERIASGPPRP